MIAPIGPEPKKPTRNARVSGAGQGSNPQTGEGVGAVTPKHSATMMVRGLRWGIGRHKRRRVVEQLAKWVDEGDPNVSIAACRALIQADAINVRALQGPHQVAVNVGVGLSIGDAVATLLQDPMYVKFAHAAAVSGTSVVCQNDQ